MILEPCDLFFTRSSSWLGWLIRTCTTTPGERRSWAQHVGLIVEPGEEMDAIAAEALTRIMWHPLRDQYGDGKTRMMIFRPLNITDLQKQQILGCARAYVGARYGYGKIGLCFGDWLISWPLGRDVRLFRRLAVVDRWPICSFYAAHCWKAGGLDFGVRDRYATPDDEMDFCQGHPDKYRMVMEIS